MKFILVRTAFPSNIGAAARAIKTMGFSELVLVSPKADLDSEKVQALAMHAKDVLDNLAVYNSLQEALSSSDLVIGATHRHRSVDRTVVKSQDLKNWTSDKGQNIAVVFGPESTGLNSQELEHCDAFVTIPTLCSQPSLNLAQSVMVIAYELSSAKGLPAPLRIQRRDERDISGGEYRTITNKVKKLSERLNLNPDTINSKIGSMKPSDLNIVHKIIQKLESIIF